MLVATRDLVSAVNRLRFAKPVSHIYNPLEYAAESHAEYVNKFAAQPKQVLFLGMNPGPFGMAQTGVPFGEVSIVRDWLGIERPVQKPAREHPARPVQGFACTRSEVSGTRLWGLFRERFGTAAKFFTRHYVANYCPLVFMSASGANITPDKLPAKERDALFLACDAHLSRVIEILRPAVIVGVGKFAEKRAQLVVDTLYANTTSNTGSKIKSRANSIAIKPPRVITILHPSPASPAANKDWAGTAAAQLLAAGVWK